VEFLRGTDLDARAFMDQATDVKQVLSWREAGDGSPIVFLHAFPFDSAMWEAQLSGLRHGWRGLAVDLPGFGRSPRREGVASLDAFADDVAETMMEAVASPAVVCGLSMGGYVAMSLYRRHPEVVRGLILCDTRAGADEQGRRLERLRLAQRTRSDGMQPICDEMLPHLISLTTRISRPTTATWLGDTIRSVDRESAAVALTAMAHRADSTETLRTIEVPTLVIVGSDDEITPPGESQMLTRAIRGARIEIIEDAAHLTNVEQPEAFNRLLNNWLATLPVETSTV
jgi:pimeloyl-ACP methyl ester carboxylesterase